MQLLFHAFGGSSVVAYMVFVKGDDQIERNMHLLKLAKKISNIETFPVCITSAIRRMVARMEPAPETHPGPRAAADGAKQGSSNAQIQSQKLKKEFDALQAHVLDLTKKLNAMHLANASLEVSCKTSEKDRLAMKTELLDSKIELNRTLEKLEETNHQANKKKIHLAHLDVTLNRASFSFN
ncbi:hypothetical protein HDU82_007649 [Entophlyctis luteolus]|nr:hypothetical protein HDU82_007649 [Entophlyctis luteolus]